MVKKRIFIDGDQGTTGLDITQRLKAFLPEIDIITLPENLRKDKKHRLSHLNDCDLAVLCLPDVAAIESVKLVENQRVKILDCSTAHRVARGFVYGLPEYNAKQKNLISQAMRVANPGCYATGFILLLAPLMRAGILPDDYPYVVVGISGYSGGGKGMIEEYETTNIKGHSYGFLQNHKHLPEMTDYGLLLHPPIFIPWVGDFPRGMVIKIPLDGRVLKNISKSLIEKIWQDNYQNCDKIILPNDDEAIMADKILVDSYNGRDDVALKVVGHDDGRLVLVAIYDNLGKGASGAALQNIQLMLDLK
ncbi:MAG: N-acetyl-gamma-glutamyl-phosphate reductase [Alphaproteobacteria bacterium]